MSALDLICILLLCNIFISDIISKIPKARDVIQLLAPVAYKWEDIGISLYIDMNELESIRMSNMSAIQKLFKVIQIWLENSDSPTWAILIATLEGPIIQSRRVAMEIREYLSKPEIYEEYESY